MAYDETKERKTFEEHMFNQRFIKGVKRVSETAQFPYKVDCPSTFELFAKNGQGDYKDKYISAMWFGWSQLAKKVR